MDRHLKERMIGAVVLVAAAVILIPEMLTGTKAPTKVGDSVALTPENAQDASKLKTYTIDLSKDVAPTPPAESPPIASLSEAMPRTTPEASSSTTAPPPEELPTLPSAPARQPAAEKKPEPPREAERVVNASSSGTQPQPESKKGNSVSTSGWSVQVGSFGVRATSDRVAADLKKDGFSAFVVAFQSGNQTMYRVRVGPERDRAAAEGLLRKLKLHHPGATLVPPA